MPNDQQPTTAWLCRWGVGNAVVVLADTIEEARWRVQLDRDVDGPIFARLATTAEKNGAVA